MVVQAVFDETENFLLFIENSRPLMLPLSMKICRRPSFCRRRMCERRSEERGFFILTPPTPATCHVQTTSSIVFIDTPSPRVQPMIVFLTTPVSPRDRDHFRVARA